LERKVKTMRNFLLAIILISHTALAGSYLPKSTNSAKCEAHYGEPCISYESNYSYSVVIAESYLKEQVEACDDADDCQSKHEAKTCDSEDFYAVKNLDSLESYCTKHVPEHIGIDQAAKDTYDANKAASDALASAMNLAKKAMTCGDDVIALMGVLNMSKGLNRGQMKSLVSDYSEIKSLLESGALETAKEEIADKVADGVLLLEADKTALIAKLNECNPL
jgi:hypothetical protein